MKIKMKHLTRAFALTALMAAPFTAQATVLFQDTFDRADSDDIDSSSVGMSGIAAPMTYWESDTIAGDNLLTQVTNSALNMAFGPNASVVGLTSHNFIDSEILTEDGFSVSMNITDLGTGTTDNHWCGFGVGISSNEINALGLDFNSDDGPRGRFDGSKAGVADMFVCYTPNLGGDLQVFFGSGGTQIDVNVGSGTLRADFFTESFDSGELVNVNIYMDDTLLLQTNFTWSGTEENYIALSSRQSTGFVVDDLLIESKTVVPLVGGFVAAPSIIEPTDTAAAVELSWMASELIGGATYAITADKAVIYPGGNSSGTALNGSTVIDATVDGSLGDVEFTLIVTSGGISLTNATRVASVLKTTSLDEDFATGYTDGNLAGQSGWLAMTGSNAFNVVTTGGGSAETMSVSNSFDTIDGNDIVWDTAVQNLAGSEWSGTVVFSYVVGDDGTEKSRVISGITNTYNIANLNARNPLNIGLTADAGNPFQPGDNEDIVLSLRVSDSQGLRVRFGGENNDCVILSREQIGWDPSWNSVDEFGEPTAGPDFETDIITCDYVIRKTTASDTYMLIADVTVGATTYQGSAKVISRATAYAAEAVDFVVSHSSDADGNNANVVHIDMDSISMDVTTDVAPPALAPIDMATATDHLTGTISWGGAWEADTVALYRSIDDSSLGSLLTNASINAFADTFTVGEDKEVYFYTTVAKYGASDSPNSETVALRVIQRETLTGWGRASDIVTGHNDLSFKDGPADITAVEVAPGSYILNAASIGNQGTDSVVNTNWYNTAAAPALFGIFQRSSGQTNLSNSGKWSNVGRDVRNGGGVGTDDALQLGTVDALTDKGWSALFWIEGAVIPTASTEYELETGNDWGNDLHLAIRDGSAWYVSELTFSGAATFNMALSDTDWTLLTPSTSTSSNLMTVSGASFAPQSFSSITAVGLFVDNRPKGSNRKIHYFGLNNSTVLTPLEQWTDGFGIYNEKAASDADPDEDTVDNITEWGFGGNPTDPADQGIVERMFGVDTGAGNLVYVYPRLKTDPRPTYTLTENTVGLNSESFVDNEGTYTITPGADWPGEPDFEAVTNEVPTDADIKFLKVQVTE